MQRFALIIAGGSGTRLWPMSTAKMPKQLLPIIEGQSLLEIAVARLQRFLPNENIFICSSSKYKQTILEKLPNLSEQNFIGEPTGRDTLNAVALGTGIIAQQNPEALVGVFTGDHLIEPQDNFQKSVEEGFCLAEKNENTLVTFGITPTYAASGYGYLQLGGSLENQTNKDATQQSGATRKFGAARKVTRFKEKPDPQTAKEYFALGANKYLWNSGMFVFRAQTLLDCAQKFAPDNYNALKKIFAAQVKDNQEQIKKEVYPTLKKISLDYAIMEPASHDKDINIVALPMDVSWLDIGSWPALAGTKKQDKQGNFTTENPALLMNTKNTLAISDNPEHLIATIGCEDLVIVHTEKATLVCRADMAEHIKILHSRISDEHGDKYI